MKLEEIRAICNAATPGPWSDEGGMTWGGTVYAESRSWSRDFPPADARFIAAARDLLPKLLAVAEAARAWLVEYDKTGPDNGPSLTEHECADAGRVALAALEAP